MALVVRQIKHIEHETEPGTWFDLRVPLSAGDLSTIGDAENMADVKLKGVTLALKAWSYDAPLTPENVRELDVLTFNWLTVQVFANSTMGDEEKNASGASLPPTTEPDMAPSHPSSDT